MGLKSFYYKELAHFSPLLCTDSILYVIQIIGGSILVISSAMKLINPAYSTTVMPGALIVVSGIISGTLLIIAGSFLFYLTFGRSGKD